jgi:cyclic pyranopterin phosphate synthase
MKLIDSFGRKINYLRLSVTDRCNMRCSYCMPAEGVSKLCHEDILSYEALFRIAQSAVALGIEKIRVTGGEPLIRKGIVDFLARLAGIPGLKQLVLTTNGLRLEEMAEELRAAGVQRLNISLDSLQQEVFARITRGGDLSRVVAGITAAERAGFPVKINMVVMRGINDAEVIDVASLALHKPYTVRFIEYMPAIKERNWQSLLVSGQEIMARVGERFEFSPVDKKNLAGPAREYRITGGVGTIGVITPITGHFCGDCNRIRVTATGMAKGCLFSAAEVDLKPYTMTSDTHALHEALRRIVTIKPGMHHVTARQSDHTPFAMSGVGG